MTAHGETPALAFMIKKAKQGGYIVLQADEVVLATSTLGEAVTFMVAKSGETFGESPYMQPQRPQYLPAPAPEVPTYRPATPPPMPEFPRVATGPAEPNGHDPDPNSPLNRIRESMGDLERLASRIPNVGASAVAFVIAVGLYGLWPFGA
jgi:hypothetical protein